VLQIPAYLCMQTTLVTEAAKTGAVINLKHGQFLAPDNMIKPVKKCESVGNKKIILTERGYVPSATTTWWWIRAAFYHLRQTGYPVVFDITHSIRKYGIPSADPRGGNRDVMPTIARAGVAAGVDGVFIETHPDPSKALCDAASQLCVYDLEEFLKPLLDLHAVEVKHRQYASAKICIASPVPSDPLGRRDSCALCGHNRSAFHGTLPRQCRHQGDRRSLQTRLPHRPHHHAHLHAPRAASRTSTR
jgi:3-deoxy-D-manno-octulosonic acid (KDO) 8-phosphate synthase